MTKRKKTVNELLEEALFVEGEQPFQVPENWVWVTLKDVCKINMGQSPKGEYTTDDSNNIPLIGGPADMGATYPNAKRYTIKPTKLSENGELIVSVRATLGKTNIADGQYCLGRGVAGIKSNIIDIRLLRYYFETIKSHLYSVSTGTTFQQISRKNIESIAFPLLPLNEQKRIADKVERLLSKIDEAKQLIEEAKETFELRRASIIRTILKEELSNGKLPTGWRNIKVKDLFTIFGGGTPSKAKEEYWNGRIPWISAKDMKTTFISKTMDYITEEGLNNSSAKLAKRGSVAMVVRSGILQRTLPVAFLLSECTVNQDLKVFDSGDELINKYFLWYVKGNERNLLHNYSKSGTTVNSIEFEKFKSHEILLPPMDVLKQKIDKIENVIEKEKSANVMLNLANSIDELKSSILSKAFRGELGTNDPSEENAVELLKEVLQEQVK
ncbi:restriction endonuclease subunit S [Bacillus mojavensis]